MLVWRMKAVTKSSSAYAALVAHGTALIEAATLGDFEPGGEIQPCYQLYVDLQAAIRSFGEFKEPKASPPRWRIPQDAGDGVLIELDPRRFKLLDGTKLLLDTASRFHSCYAAMPQAASAHDVLTAFGQRVGDVQAAVGIRLSELRNEVTFPRTLIPT
jgi:hypothetical protein